MRDDFTQATKTQLALRAGGVCSNPNCRRSTFGAKQGKDGYHNVGVAAHITAASPGGPRYNATLTNDQRRHADNGIWLCQTHGDLVDGDEKNFTVEILREWKRDAEYRSFQSLVGLGPASGMPQEAAIDAIQELRAAEAADIEARLARLIVAASADLASFKRMPGWPKHPIALNLRLRDDDGRRSFNVAGFAAAVEAFNEFAVVAQPGTGKSTTLIQVADAIHSIGRAMAVYIPLGEWSTQDKGFISTVLARLAFKEAGEANFYRLAQHGRLVLILDGWNELDAGARKRATAQLRALRRDFPRLCVLISTRRQALDLPIGGQSIDIDALVDDQQLEIASALRGQDGEALLDAAWRTPGVRDLVSNPLYLTALLSATPGDRLPTTKEEILRLFAKQHECSIEKAEVLREALFGFHPQMLTAIAVEATQTANTSISDTRGRAAVSTVEQRLIADGQISDAPQPTRILDVLVGQHTLIRSEHGALSFQHQQFQEWYASFEVEQVLRAAACGNAEDVRRLREEFLDKRPWEESVLFACERLSRESSSGAQAIAEAILRALSIDPLLAAEMIYRSSESLWAEVSSEVLAFVQRWHKPGQVDRAVSFMITSGRPEFAAMVWPLIESRDQQIYLSVMRAARRFRPSVLGPEAAKRLAALPEKARGHVLGELARRSDVQGMDLATEIAGADPSPKVQCEVIWDLAFRRGDRHVTKLLKDAPDAVWAQLAKHGHSEEIAPSWATDRLAAARASIMSETTDPAAAFGLLLDEKPSPALEQSIEDALASKDFPPKNHHAVLRAAELFPDALARGLLRRLEAGLELPYAAGEYLSNVPVVDSGPIAVIALNSRSPEPAGIVAAGVAGPDTAKALMDALEEAAERFEAATPPSRQAISAELQLWESRVAATPATSFVSALLTRQPRAPPAVISSIASTVWRHGTRAQDKPPLELGSEVERVIELLRGWAEALIADKQSTRYHLSSLAQAIGRTRRPELLGPLKSLRDEDAHRRRAAQAQALAAGAQVSIELRSDAATVWNLQYREAFTQIGLPAEPLLIAYLADEDFGFDAACALKSIHDRVHGITNPHPFKSWPNLPDAASRRAERACGVVKGNSDCANAIFAEVERLISDGSSEEQQDLAIKIARMAVAMPYHGKEGPIERLLALERPARTKRELVAALVMAGETFTSNLALTAIAEWIEDAKQNPWRFEQGEWEVTGWLELLPFSDRPESVLDGMKQVTDAAPHPRKMERVVIASGVAPGLSERYLLELFRRFPHLASQHTWAQAILERGTISSIQIVLTLVNEGSLGTGPLAVDSWWLSRQIAHLAKNDGTMMKDILRLHDAANGPQQRILERVFEETGGAPAVLALVKGYARAGRRFDGSLHQALQYTAVERHPIPGSAAYSLHPVSIAPLRKELFAMMHGSDVSVAAIAEECLSNIDQLRDYMGAAESEPRHPDVASGKPWPRQAASL